MTRPLARWYGEPLDHETAATLLARSDRRAAELRRRGARCRCCAIARLIARHWLDLPVEQDYQDLRVRAKGRRLRALVELVHGQLLAARRLPGASRHLREGFELARGLFAPGDYFAVLERHRLLALIPHASGPGQPASLQELLAAATVIERLRRGPRKRAPHDPTDSHG